MASFELGLLFVKNLDILSRLVMGFCKIPYSDIGFYHYSSVDDAIYTNLVSVVNTNNEGWRFNVPLSKVEGTIVKRPLIVYYNDNDINMKKTTKLHQLFRGAIVKYIHEYEILKFEEYMEMLFFTPSTSNKPREIKDKKCTPYFVINQIIKEVDPDLYVVDPSISLATSSMFDKDIVYRKDRKDHRDYKDRKDHKDRQIEEDKNSERPMVNERLLTINKWIFNKLVFYPNLEEKIAEWMNYHPFRSEIYQILQKIRKAYETRTPLMKSLLLNYNQNGDIDDDSESIDESKAEGKEGKNETKEEVKTSIGFKIPETDDKFKEEFIIVTREPITLQESEIGKNLIMYYQTIERIVNTINRKETPTIDINQMIGLANTISRTLNLRRIEPLEGNYSYHASLVVKENMELPVMLSSGQKIRISSQNFNYTCLTDKQLEESLIAIDVITDHPSFDEIRTKITQELLRRKTPPETLE